MIRGLFTGAAGMISKMHEMNDISNNLANIDKTGYKRDITVFKSFPEILIRRQEDDGVVEFPLGSYDKMPVVGNLGTGVEVNEVFTAFDQGHLHKTENSFDLAIEGDGFFTVETGDGIRYTRNGSFLIDRDGYLVNKHGDFILGQNGKIKLQKHNFTVDEKGNILVNKSLYERKVVDDKENVWDSAELIDQLKIVNFRQLRGLRKRGNSYYTDSELSGPAFNVTDLKIHQGFLEKSNVNAVTEMVKMIEVQRSYEANQRVLQTHDELLGKVINQVGRV